MTGESQVEEPRTEAGRMERTVAGLRLSDKASGLWWQPNPMAGPNAMQSATSDVRAAIRAIEDEAWDAALDGLREQVAYRQARWMLSEGDAADARCGAYDDVLDFIEAAAITALRQPQEVKDTRGEPR